MTPNRHNRIGELFLAVRNIDPQHRKAHLDAACVDDPSLRHEVQSLLDADVIEPDFLAAATAERIGSPIVFDPGERFVGTRLGKYFIVRVIGSGGMGTVFEAMQESPRRRVAVKMMRPGLASPNALRRFEYESQALAMLRHSCIAQVYDAGVHESASGPVPYFAMEFVEGARTIQEYSRSEALDIRRRLNLFANVCDAVEHAHRVGVIHRDLKPDNILVDQLGQPKIIDFGIARLTQSDQQTVTLQTTAGEVLGTIPYMSPEQAGGDSDQIDTRTDVYSLGVILYELLTSHSPYPTRGSLTDLLDALRYKEPTPPRIINPKLDDEVETIVLKSLQKDCQRRYQSAGELARDIQAYLKGEMIIAKRNSQWYVLRKIARRHRALLGAAGAFIIMLIASLAVSLSQMTKAQRAELRATQQYHSASQISEFYSRLLLQADPWSQHSIRLGIPPGEIRLADLLREAAQRVPGTFADRPELAASIQRNIGRALNGLALPEEAERIFRESYELARSSLGDDHPATLELRRNLGNCLISRHEVEKGIHILDEVAQRTIRVLGERHEQSLLALLSLNWPRITKGDSVQESEAVSAKVLAVAEQILPPDDPLYIEALIHRASVLAYHGRWAEAEPFVLRAIERSRQGGSSQSLYVAFALQVYAITLEFQERWTDAMEVLQEAVDIRRIAEGQHHINHDRSLRDLFVVLGKVGRCDEAIDMGHKLAGAQARHGATDYETVLTYSQLARTLTSCGSADAAVRFARERLDALPSVSPDDRIRRRHLGLALAAALEMQGRASEAQELAHKVLRDAPLGAAFIDYEFCHPEHFVHTGRWLAQLGQFEGSELRLQGAFNGLSSARAHGDDKLIQSVIMELTRLYEAWNKPQEAAKWLSRQVIDSSPEP